MSDFRGCVLEADLTWTGECFESDVQIRCDKDGRITEVGQDIAQKSDKLVRLPDQALLPGFVSAHSHAFHRGMRGSSHIGTDNAANSFWCWRQDMFQTVETMTANALFDVCRQTFSEMLAAGITTVGDFHYFHHGENKYEFDKVMLKAAKSAGIRIVLLETYYKQAGLLQQELAPAQTRFVSTSLNEFWHNFAELQNGLEPTQTLGIAAHSIRAVPTEDIKALWQEAKRRAIPFHMHMEEQPLEIKDALDALGTTPTDFVLQHLAPNELFTSVHATYTPNDKLTHLFTTGANVCICPLTEGYLGDGIPNLSIEKMDDSQNICLGTDCNNRLSMIEEMRWLAYCQQMKYNARGVCGFSASKLLKIATKNGARALGLGSKCGELAAGQWCDFVSIDLRASELSGLDKSTLLDGLVFGSGNSSIAGTCVGAQIVFSKQPSLPTEIRSVEAAATAVSMSESSSIEELLIAMMSIDSTTGQEGKVGKALEKYLTKRGWYVLLQPIEKQLQRMNLLATRKRYVSPGPKLLFNSHLDTVPPYIPPSRSQGVIKGRGSCDAKGQIAAMIYAAEQLIKEHPEIADDIGMLFVVGEETDHVGMKEANKLDLKPDYLLVGEPTELSFGRMQKGALKIDLISRGKAAHSGYPHMGKSAIDPLLDVLNDLRDEEWPSDPELGETTMNIGLISGGQALNALPESASASIFFRLVTSPDDILKRVAKIANGRANIGAKIGRNEPVGLTTPPAPYPSQVVAFNTDIPYFTHSSSAKGVFLFGAGSITDAHSEWEFVKESDLHSAVEVYVDMAKRLLLSETK